LGVVIASLSALKIVGKPIRGMNRRPLEPSFQYGADYAGLVPVEGAGGRNFDAGFTTPDGTLILADAKRTALIHKGKVCSMLEKVCPEFLVLNLKPLLKTSPHVCALFAQSARWTRH